MTTITDHYIIFDDLTFLYGQYACSDMIGLRVRHAETADGSQCIISAIDSRREISRDRSLEIPIANLPEVIQHLQAIVDKDRTIDCSPIEAAE